MEGTGNAYCEEQLISLREEANEGDVNLGVEKSQPRLGGGGIKGSGALGRRKAAALPKLDGGRGGPQRRFARTNTDADDRRGREARTHTDARTTQTHLAGHRNGPAP